MVNHKETKEPSSHLGDLAERLKLKKALVRHLSKADMAELLMDIRRMCNISQTDMHKATGISLKTIRNNEQGISTPSAPTLLAYLIVADHYGVRIRASRIQELLESNNEVGDNEKDKSQG